MADGIDASNWAKLSAWFDEAIEAEPAARTAVIARARDDDPALAAQLERMLSVADETGDPFATAAGQTPVPANALSPGDRIGSWRIDSVIGRGGMGIVHGVERVEGGFAQQGALKIVRPDTLGDTQRFLRERQLLAGLTHPGIARVLDGGIGGDGLLWMVQERISGSSIDRWCAEQNASLTERLRLGIAIADAIASAHAAMVLHRDLKPGNVLVDGDGEVRVIDFGLAKSIGLGADTVGPLPVSAPYVAPELLTGAPAGPACDVYGLGALLYELVMLRPPVDLAGLPPAIGIGRVLDVAPTPVGVEDGNRAIISPAPAAMISDLSAVLLKALRKEPEARYPAIAAMRDDLQRVLDGQPVEARRGEQGYLLRRQLRRWRWPIAAAAAIALSLMAGLGATLWQAREAIAARDRALAEEARAESVRQSLYLLLSESSAEVGDAGDRRAVLQRAAERLRARLADDPGLAPVMYALGELYFYLGDYDGALANLRALTAPSVSASIAPDVLANARYDLAQVLLRTGNATEAPSLLAAAQTYWASDPLKWRAKLIDSRILESQIVRATDPARALTIMESALAEQLRHFGKDVRQTGVFYNNIGVARQAAGDLPAARAAFTEAQGIWQRIGQAETPDALNTANNLAAIAMLEGDIAAAEQQFAQAVAIRRSSFGPSAGTAALINNLGKVRLKLGKFDEAIALLAEAEAMGGRFAGPASQLRISALAGLSEAYVGQGRMAEGLTAARTAHAATRAETGLPALLAEIALGRAEAAAGNATRARALLVEVERKLAAAGPAAGQLQAQIADIRRRYAL